jgi:hypothetical protein
VAVALAGCEVTVRELTLRTPTLDDVFLDLTGSHIERAGSGSESGTEADTQSDIETEEVAS